MARVVKKPEERKSEIIAASCRLFLKRGYGRTTMQDVMKELGIAKGTIYHYFRSKEELLEAVIMKMAEEEAMRLKEVFNNSEGSALDRLRKVVLSGQVQGDSHDEMIEHLHQPANAEMHVRLLAQLVTMQAPVYAELFVQGCEEGIFTTDSPLECAELLLSGIQFLTDLGIYQWTGEQLERRWKAFPRLIESLLKAPVGSFQFLHEIATG